MSTVHGESLERQQLHLLVHWQLVVATNTSTGTTTTSAAGEDDHTKLNNFKKTYKSEKDYEVLKSEEYFQGWKKKFERKA